MQLSADQIRQISATYHHGRARALQHSVSQALPREQQADPAARLQALASQVHTQVPAADLAAAMVVDLRQAGAWLQMGLAHGAAYREPRCAALLHAAAALGALWFVDDRLLPPGQQLPLGASLADSMLRLLSEPQGARFKHAADTERLRRDGLRRALRRVLAHGATPEATQAMVAAAFNQPPVAGAGTSDLGDDEAQEEGDAPAALDAQASAAAQRFIAHERKLLQQAGIAPGAVHTLCLCGDLAVGLGRCVRLLASAGQGLDETAQLAHLKGAIHGLAG